MAIEPRKGGGGEQIHSTQKILSISLQKWNVSIRILFLGSLRYTNSRRMTNALQIVLLSLSAALQAQESPQSQKPWLDVSIRKPQSPSLPHSRWTASKGISEFTTKSRRGVCMPRCTLDLQRSGRTAIGQNPPSQQDGRTKRNLLRAAI